MSQIHALTIDCCASPTYFCLFGKMLTHELFCGFIKLRGEGVVLGWHEQQAKGGNILRKSARKCVVKYIREEMCSKIYLSCIFYQRYIISSVSPRHLIIGILEGDNYLQKNKQWNYFRGKIIKCAQDYLNVVFLIQNFMGLNV